MHNSCGRALSLYSHAAAPEKSVVYCTAATNSLGCVSRIASSGVPSASAAGSFQVTASEVLNQASGFLIYGFKTGDNPLSGGLWCIGGARQRTPVQFAGGSLAGSNCSSAFAFDFNAHVQSGFDPLLAPGVEVFAQYWSRDPNAAGGLNVTDGLRFALCS